MEKIKEEERRVHGLLINQLINNITHKRRLCLDESTGFLPVTISKRRTPNAKTSVFSSTKPCMKYSGAKYPNVPSIGTTAWCVHLFGSHFASPKSVIYQK